MPINLGSDKLVRINLPAPGEWVEVVEKMGTDHEAARIANFYFGQDRVAIQDAQAALNAVDVGRLAVAAPIALMAAVIKKWSFTSTRVEVDERTGRTTEITEPLPINMHTCIALDAESKRVINEKLAELYPAPISEEEAKNSLGDGPAPSITVLPSPADSSE